MLIIAGRDDLEDTHPGWGQHCKRYLTDQIRLRPFDAETAAQLMAAGGIPEGRRAAIYELTQDFPLVLSLAIEEASTDGGVSPLPETILRPDDALDEPRRARAVYPHVYLDEVNEVTLRLVFTEEDIGAVQDWFEGEASIRHPSAPTFRVRPLIREKVLSYMEVRSPNRHCELRSRAQAGRATPSS